MAGSELSEATRALLREAGWQDDRVIDTTEYEQALAAEGYPIHDQVLDFLRCYGGLKVKQDKIDFQIDPRPAIDLIYSERVTEEYNLRVGSSLCVIGLLDGQMVLMMDDRGVVYGGYDETLIRFSESGEQGLESLCWDRITEEIPLLIDYAELFADTFDKPIVEMGPSPVPGIHWGAAYDESDLAEDPFTPPLWIATEDGWKENLCSETVIEALKRVAFDPQSEEEALRAARLNFTHPEIILKDPVSSYPLPQTVPQEIMDQVTEPRVTRKGDYFEVVLYVHLHDTSPLWFEPDSDMEVVMRYTGRISKDQYYFGVETLWSKR